MKKKALKDFISQNAQKYHIPTQDEISHFLVKNKVTDYQLFATLLKEIEFEILKTIAEGINHEQILQKFPGCSD